MTNGEPQLTRPLFNRHIKIGTHDGTFHCDEVLGTYLLQIIYPDSEIVRSRDQNILSTCDIVIDVGGKYDPSKHLYDHHQREFNESFSTVVPGKPWTTKLSSAGLVYCHFGLDIISKILGIEKTDDLVNMIYDKAYENFIEEIDGIDNGVPQFDGEPRYCITTNLSSRVSKFNKQWNSTDEFNESETFQNAQKLVGSEFTERVLGYANVWWPARKIVKDSILNRFNIDESGEIVELLSGHCPWKEHLFELEKQMGIEKTIIYVLFSDNHNRWRVQAVSVTSRSFILRIPLASEWQGLRDEELSNVAGIKGCIFVHSSGFIGGNETREGALQMALKSLELYKNKQTKTD